MALLSQVSRLGPVVFLFSHGTLCLVLYVLCLTSNEEVFGLIFVFDYLEQKELEQILTDKVKKKKYQQQVTVFVVGFQDVCTQKMQLLQQVNQV